MVGAADGVHADELAGTMFLIEGSVSGEVIRTGRTVVLADAAGDRRVRAAPRAGGSSTRPCSGYQELEQKAGVVTVVEIDPEAAGTLADVAPRHRPARP